MEDSSLTVLVVDDHRLTAEITGMALESSGFRVLIEEDGPSALARLAGDASIRAVVSDLNMPGMDGLALLEAMRSQGYALPFVLLTGQAETGRVSGRPGPDAVVAKDEAVEETLPPLLWRLLRGAAGPGLEAPAAPQGAPDQLPGLDLASALKALNQDRGILKTLLLAFQEEYRNAPAELLVLRNAGDARQCLARLHTLKGAAGMLGATRLPQAAADLERAIQAQADGSHWEAFASSMQELLGSIQGI
jgi:CheY-like chemotaxis protein/HPt (histidine-containing phosphotransfer) domain-containing protein